MKYFTLRSGLIAMVIAFLFSACKKDTGSNNNPPSLFANGPTCAYASSTLAPGGGITQFITFMDLRSSNVADKKYFTVQLKYVGVKDSFEVVTQPQSINNLATGFPAEITEYPGFGLLNQWTNSQYRLLTNGGSSYVKDTIVRNPASNYYFLYQNYLSGGLKNEWPQSNLDNYYVPTGSNGQNSLHYRTIFYFNKGFCFDANNMEPGNNVKSISNFFTGAPNIYDWTNVDAAIQIVHFPVQNPNPNNFYFFDFKNWRYFKWKQYMNNIFSPAVLATEFGGYESLDNLLKWPAGWGKK